LLFAARKGTLGEGILADWAVSLKIRQKLPTKFLPNKNEIWIG